MDSTDLMIEYQPDYIQNLQVVFFLYKIDDRKSFEQLEYCFDELQQVDYKQKELKYWVIGTNAENEELREVSRKQGQYFSKKIGGLFVGEISSYFDKVDDFDRISSKLVVERAIETYIKLKLK